MELICCLQFGRQNHVKIWNKYVLVGFHSRFDGSFGYFIHVLISFFDFIHESEYCMLYEF